MELRTRSSATPGGGWDTGLRGEPALDSAGAASGTPTSQERPPRRTGSRAIGLARGHGPTPGPGRRRGVSTGPARERAGRGASRGDAAAQPAPCAPHAARSPVAHPRAVPANPGRTALRAGVHDDKCSAAAAEPCCQRASDC